MTHHRPTPSELLRIYQALLGRMYFPQNMNHSYQNELKGYEGEMKVNQLIKKLLKPPFLQCTVYSTKIMVPSFNPIHYYLPPTNFTFLKLKIMKANLHSTMIIFIPIQPKSIIEIR